MRKRRHPKFVNQKIYKKVEVSVPNSLYDILQRRAIETGISIQKLVVLAIDNEITESESPFTYDVNHPKHVPPYPEHVEEGRRIIDYLNSIKHYVQKEILVAARRDMGIEDRDLFLKAYAEILDAGMIEEFLPSPIYNWKPHPDAKFVRSKVKPPEEPPKPKYKPVSRYKKD